jgi:predicted SAM-dependent methyltransferase
VTTVTLDSEYYSAKNQSYGFVGVGYRDFLGNANAALIISELNPRPTSVIDIGGARGYTAKTLSTVLGIPVTVMEKSQHCYHTRATNDFVLHDMYDFPYPFEDKQFDVAYSNSVLEHVDYEHVDGVIKEMARISNRGYHVIGFRHVGGDTSETPTGVFFEDGTHIIYETLDWWKKKFERLVPGYHFDIFNAYGSDLKLRIPSLRNDHKSLNLGCGTNLFGSGWINVDKLDISKICTDPLVSETFDITNRLPYGDNSCDYIFLGNIIETLEIDKGVALMQECYRVLKKGGMVRVSVVNSELLMRKYLNGDIDFVKHIHVGSELSPCDIIKLSYAMFDGMGTVYDTCLLREVLKRSGFEKMTTVNAWSSSSPFLSATTCVSYPTISLVMEAQK